MATNKKQPRWSLAGQLLALCLTLVVLTCLLSLALLQLQRQLLPLPVWVHGVVLLAIMVPVTTLIVQRFYRPIARRLQALTDGAANLRENDFSTSIAGGRNDEIGELIRAFNDVSRVLRDERRNIFQRELLLDTVLQAAPLALVLTDLQQRIIYANPHARHLFLDGHKLEGFNFEHILEDSPQALREAVLEERQGLVTIDNEGEPEIYHIARQHFSLNARDHQLWLFRPLTRELNRQEVATWKKVIRVISHELNNSLAPIASLANSGLQFSSRYSSSGNDATIAGLKANSETSPQTGQRMRQSDTPENGPVHEKLQLIFTTIAERSQHLHRFIEGYARFARLPRPQRQWVVWADFLRQVGETQQFNLIQPLPRQPGYFDPVQLEQALINLLKNAHEAGSPATEVALRIHDEGRGVRIQVLDRGNGISPVVMANAVLPFYSTKKSGSGLGLALCREIMEAHDGRLAITNRLEGGTCVSLWLPTPPAGDQPYPHRHQAGIHPTDTTQADDSRDTRAQSPDKASQVNQ